MLKPRPDFNELNRYFNIDNYLATPDEERAKFRNELKDKIIELKKDYRIKLMTKEDVLQAGLRIKNKTAIAISILNDRLTPYNYDQTFNFRETITILRRQLLDELFNGKVIFYPINKNLVGIDPNYVPFIIGKKFNELKINN